MFRTLPGERIRGSSWSGRDRRERALDEGLGRPLCRRAMRESRAHPRVFGRGPRPRSAEVHPRPDRRPRRFGRRGRGAPPGAPCARPGCPRRPVK